MTLREFHNNLRVMQSIDRHELEDAGILLTTPNWAAFRTNPFVWLIKAGDDDAERLWSIIQSRQPKVPA